MSAFAEERTGYRSGGRSPVGIGGAVAVHAVAFGIFLLMPKEMIERITTGTLETTNIPLAADPPKDVEKPREAPLQKRDVQTFVPDIVVPTIPANGPVIDITNIPVTPVHGDTFTPDPPVAPPRAPVFVGARVNQRYADQFQPAYPAGMLRAQLEGSVTVRVTIGADGRVKAIDRLTAASDAFWEATRDQAMRRWRFEPATRDGVAVESVREMTVHFRIT